MYKSFLLLGTVYIIAVGAVKKIMTASDFFFASVSEGNHKPTARGNCVGKKSS